MDECEVPSQQNYFLLHPSSTGADSAFFVVDLGCCRAIRTVGLKNAKHNNDRSFINSLPVFRLRNWPHMFNSWGCLYTQSYVVSVLGPTDQQPSQDFLGVGLTCPLIS